MEAKNYIVLPKDCLKYLHDFELLYYSLTHCSPFKYNSIPKSDFKGSCVYTFCDSNSTVYVGYSSTSLETTIKKQFSDNRANLLAWKMFFDRYKDILKTYAVKDLKISKLSKDSEFISLLENLKNEIKHYDIKAVNISNIGNNDTAKETLFEIFTNIRSKSKYNDFD